MDDQPVTDPSTVVPPAAPLTGKPPDPDQPAPSDVLPSGRASELGHLKSEEEQDG
jgi:hypothetical protein